MYNSKQDYVIIFIHDIECFFGNIWVFFLFGQCKTGLCKSFQNKNESNKVLRCTTHKIIDVISFIVFYTFYLEVFA